MAFSSIAKDMNKELIINTMRSFESYTKQDIAKETGLSFPTVSKMIDEMAERNIINIIEEKKSQTGGRRAQVYQLNQFYAYSLCLFLEEKRLYAKIVDLKGVEFQSIEKAIINAVTFPLIEEFIRECMAECEKIQSIAIGVPGAVHEGKIFLIDGFEEMQGCELEKKLRNCFHMPTCVINNMSAVAFAISKNEKDNIGCFHLGEKGPGCSCVVNGAPISGFCGFQGELGFIPFYGQKTSRDLFMKEPQKIDMTEFVGKMLISIITIVNPKRIILYLPENEWKLDFKKYCSKFIPVEVLPEFIFSDSYDEDYMEGVKMTGVSLIFHTMNRLSSDRGSDK